MPYKQFEMPEFPCRADMWDELARETRPIVVYGMGNGADKLIRRFEKYNIEIDSNALLCSSYEIEQIAKLCETYNVSICNSMFQKKVHHVEKVILTCKRLGVEVSGNVFVRTPEEIEGVCQVCRELGIEVTGSTFRRTASELRELKSICVRSLHSFYEYYFITEFVKKQDDIFHEFSVSKICKRENLKNLPKSYCLCGTCMI